MATDRLDALERLARLRDAGTLSEAEFQVEKAILLQGSGTAPSVDTKSAPAEVERSPSGETEHPKLTPVWARKRRFKGATQVVILLFTIIVVTLGTTIWLVNRDREPTYSFMATGPANIRDAPTTGGTNVVGKLAQGEFIVGRVVRQDEAEWVRITDGPLAGRFVWADNLATEGPEAVLLHESDMRSDSPTASPTEGAQDAPNRYGIRPSAYEWATRAGFGDRMHREDLPLMPRRHSGGLTCPERVLSLQNAPGPAPTLSELEAEIRSSCWTIHIRPYVENRTIKAIREDHLTGRQAEERLSMEEQMEWDVIRSLIRYELGLKD